MLVFIDESGCSGFKLTRGSDAVFAIGMVIFDDTGCAARTRQCMAELRARLEHKAEFKFSKSNDRVRELFFRAMADCPFKVRAIVVDKIRVSESRLRECDGPFYRFFLGQLMRRASSRLEHVRIKIDGNGDRHFERALKLGIRRQLQGTIADLRIVDSSRDDLMQLADMCVGAVARASRPVEQNDRWLQILSRRVEDVWLFE